MTNDEIAEILVKLATANLLTQDCLIAIAETLTPEQAQKILQPLEESTKACHAALSTIDQALEKAIEREKN